MMGPEAMGIATANLSWPDEKVCRNFLCGTCPHTLFTNTVRICPICDSKSPVVDASLHHFPLSPCVISFFPLENGSRSLPQITYRKAEDRISCGSRAKPDRPDFCQISDRIREQHFCFRR